MARHSSTSLPNVQSWGQLLPVDALRRILNRDKGMDGLSDADFHLVGERQNEAINRSWQKMLTVWRGFMRVRESLGPAETGTSQTREYCLLPLFQELGYGRLSPARAEDRLITLPDGGSASYPISHFRDESPIHLVGCQVSLDRKAAGVTGAARQSPHSLVQEFLNRSDAHLWGFVSNGLVLRILRDNASLSRQAYVEFDLEGIFSGESFSEFALLWLCAHHSRVHTDGVPPEQCWLERWSREAHSAAVAALDTLRGNVTGAIQILGRGFMESNTALRGKLANGALDRQEYFRQLLRLAYRLIFLFVVEERGLLHAPGASPEAVERYDTFWSLSRLRRLAEETHGSRHHDLWEGVKLVMRSLRAPEGCPFLGLSPMGGFLWSEAALPDLAGLELSNASLLDAVRTLAFTDFAGERRPVDWRHLGAQELGSVYESLLELHPEISGASFELQAAQGNDRKTSGSYYTPSPLIESLLETALDPVIQEAARADQPELALLSLKICDPACGSGHFLLAAAHRIAKRLASLRSGDSEPSVNAMRHALRDVAARCVYGVDINPMSVELCKVGLWLETHEPGKPLSFLDHHIVCAGSLMGTTAEAICRGLPDAAYAALESDDKKAATALKKQNSLQQQARGRQFEQFEEKAQAVLRAVQPLALEELPAATLEDMERRERAYHDWLNSREWRLKKFLYDLWTAAFVLPRHFPPREDGRTLPDGTPLASDLPFGVTWNTLVRAVNGEPLPPALMEAVEKAAADYQFFHAEVMFPEVAAQKGFDAVLGNPPWERIKLQEKEWFAANNCPGIAGASNAAVRRRKIAALEHADPLIFGKWRKALRQAEGYSHFLRNSGLYPFCGRGDINLYAVFAEGMRNMLNDGGRLGCIVPSGIATDDTTKFFFQNLVETQSLVSLYDFENKGIFPGVHASYKFSLLTAGSGAKPLAEQAQFVFFAHSTDELRDPQKRFTLSPADIALLNPNTRTCPIFRSSRDAELTKAVYRRVPVLLREARDGRPEENPWGVKFGSMFHMSNDSRLFRTREELEDDGWLLVGNVFEKAGKNCLPLYEAKMIHHFTHRWATYRPGREREPETRDVTLEELQNPHFCVQPRYWVAEEEVRRQLDAMGWKHGWLMGWRDITNATNERTVISGILPLSAVGNKIPLLIPNTKYQTLSFALNAVLNSFVQDYVARQKMGGTTLNFFIAEQIAVLPPSAFAAPAPWQPSLPLAEWLRPRILELSYTAEDMRPFAEDLGFHGVPFVWDEARRAELRAELDAAFFHLYLPANPDGTWKQAEKETDAEYQALTAAFSTPRHAVDYIMDTFPIVKRKDEAAYGSYRTKERILAAYDAMLNHLP